MIVHPKGLFIRKIRQLRNGACRTLDRLGSQYKMPTALPKLPIETKGSSVPTRPGSGTSAANISKVIILVQPFYFRILIVDQRIQHYPKYCNLHD
jgi:hypothetical protein